MDPREALNTELDPSRPVTEARPPTPEELRAAPFLWEWALMAGSYGLRLMGMVRGHPDCPEATDIITSQFMEVDPDLAWARTENRYYRLGKPQDPAAYALALRGKWEGSREGWEARQAWPARTRSLV